MKIMLNAVVVIIQLALGGRDACGSQFRAGSFSGAIRSLVHHASHTLVAEALFFLAHVALAARRRRQRDWRLN